MKNKLGRKLGWPLALTGVITTFGIALADGDGASDGEYSKVRIGYEIAPVPLDTKGKNRVLIGLGSYIVNAQSACNDCHTHPSFAPGGDPYQGQPEIINSEEHLAGGVQFGPFTSPNITPNSEGLPAGLTFPEFREVLKTGHDPNGSGRILQVMPWTSFGKMSDPDLRAIYEYLRAIPSRPDNPSPGP
ncbi:MAG: cytochrome C [Pseudomonadota bacterium]|nr:cytochrome C [Pseudomonadota bacterium]